MHSWQPTTTTGLAAIHIKNATGTTNEVTNDIFIEYKPEPESTACSTQFVPNLTKEPFFIGVMCLCISVFSPSCHQSHIICLLSRILC